MAIQDAIHGSVQLASGNSSVDVTLSGDDVIVPGNTILTWNNEDGTAAPESNLIAGQIVSSTILRFSLSVNATRDMDIEYHLAEHDSSVVVQNLTEVDVADGDASADFTEVVLANAFINLLGIENAGGTWGSDDRIRCEFDVTSKKNIDFANGNGSGGGADTWHAQVVESTDFDVTYFEELAFTEATDTKDISISAASLSAVTDAFAAWSIEGPDSEQIKHAFQIGAIQSTTNWRLTRDDDATDHENSVSLFIVEPGSGTTIEHVAGQIDSGDSTTTPTITAVDTEKAQIFHGSPDGRGWGAVDRTDDNFITCAHFTKFTTEGSSITSVTVTRASTTNSCVFRFSVVEWGVATGAQSIFPALLSGGSTTEPSLLPEVLLQLLSGGSVLAPALLPKVAAQRLSGGSTTEPSLLPLVSPQRLSGGSVLDPGLLPKVSPQRLSGGSTAPPSLLPEVLPQRLSGGSTLEPVLSLGLTVSPQLLSGGSVLDPGLLGEVHPQLLSGGSVTLPTILPEIHPQRLSGGAVLSPELLAEIHTQLLSGGAVLLPTLATDQPLNAQLLFGGSVLSPSLLAELHPQLISGGSVLLPVVSTAGVSVQLLDDGFVLLPVISGARFINPQLLSGGSVLLPGLLIFLSGVFRVWVIDGPPRTLTVKAPPRTLIVPDE